MLILITLNQVRFNRTCTEKSLQRPILSTYHTAFIRSCAHVPAPIFHAVDALVQFFRKSI